MTIFVMTTQRDSLVEISYHFLITLSSQSNKYRNEIQFIIKWSPLDYTKYKSCAKVNAIIYITDRN